MHRMRAVDSVHGVCIELSQYLFWAMCTALTHDHALTLERRCSGLERIRNGINLPAANITQIHRGALISDKQSTIV